MTLPFSDALIAKLRAATAWTFEGEIGDEIFTPRFFCCTNPNVMGIAPGKQPVAVLRLNPNPAYAGETINFDGTDSYDPDGSIVGYSWTFEGQTPSSSTSGSGTFVASGPGVYLVQLVVEDGTGLFSAPARVRFVVEDGNLKAFAAVSGGDLVYTGDGGQNWSVKDNTIAFASVTIDPATQKWSDSNKVVWAGGIGKIIVSRDGGNTWVDKTPATISNSWSDSPAPTPADVTFAGFHWVDNYLFAIARWENGSSQARSWLLRTGDAHKMRFDTNEAVVWSEM